MFHVSLTQKTNRTKIIFLIFLNRRLIKGHLNIYPARINNNNKKGNTNQNLPDDSPIDQYCQ